MGEQTPKDPYVDFAQQLKRAMDAVIDYAVDGFVERLKAQTQYPPSLQTSQPCSPEESPPEAKH
jgi:hypothetical protein